MKARRRENDLDLWIVRMKGREEKPTCAKPEAGEQELASQSYSRPDFARGTLKIRRIEHLSDHIAVSRAGMSAAPAAARDGQSHAAESEGCYDRAGVAKSHANNKHFDPLGGPLNYAHVSSTIRALAFVAMNEALYSYWAPIPFGFGAGRRDSRPGVRSVDHKTFFWEIVPDQHALKSRPVRQTC